MLVWGVTKGQCGGGGGEGSGGDKCSDSGCWSSSLPSLLGLLEAEALSEVTGQEEHSPLLAPVTTAIFPVKSVEQHWRSQRYNLCQTCTLSLSRRTRMRRTEPGPQTGVLSRDHRDIAEKSGLPLEVLPMGGWGGTSQS